MEQPSYYAVIPANVRYDKRLMFGAKMMYGEITCLSNKTGKCYASNEYFANQYGVSERQIQRRIKDLEKYGYIGRELIYKNGSIEVGIRYLFLYDTMTKTSGPHDENVAVPHDENVVDNNTRVYNNKIYNNNKQEKFFSEKDSNPLQTNTLKENPPIPLTPHARKKYDTVDSIYEDIIEQGYIDTVFPNIDHGWLKIELLTMLDWYMKKKGGVSIPKSAVKNWFKDKDYKKVIVRSNNSGPWREKEVEESFNS